MLQTKQLLVICLNIVGIVIVSSTFTFNSTPPQPPVMPIPALTLNTGRRVPAVGFGTYELKPEKVFEAIQLGYRLIDEADFYQNEQQVGTHLRKALDSGLVKREDLFVASKVWPTWHAKGRPTASAKRSLARLQIGYLDLLLIHWPFQFRQTDDNYYPGRDEKGVVELDETIEYTDVWREFEQILQSGVTRAIGVSNFNSKQIQRLLDLKLTVPAVNEIESQPYFNNNKLVEWCQKRGIVVMAYSPLGSTGHVVNPKYPGLGNATKPQTSKHGKFIPPVEDPLITSLANKYQVPTGSIIIRWHTQRNVVPLPKSSSADRMKANLNIFHFQLTDDEMLAINGLDRGLRGFTFDFFGISKHRHYPFHEPF